MGVFLNGALKQNFSFLIWLSILFYWNFEWQEVKDWFEIEHCNQKKMHSTHVLSVCLFLLSVLYARVNSLISFHPAPKNPEFNKIFPANSNWWILWIDNCSFSQTSLTFLVNWPWKLENHDFICFNLLPHVLIWKFLCVNLVHEKKNFVCFVYIKLITLSNCSLILWNQSEVEMRAICDRCTVVIIALILDRTSRGSTDSWQKAVANWTKVLNIYLTLHAVDSNSYQFPFLSFVFFLNNICSKWQNLITHIFN